MVQLNELQKAVSRRRSSVTKFVILAVVSAVALLAWVSARNNKQADVVESLAHLISMSTNELKHLDIGLVNLLCVDGLRGGAGMSGTRLPIYSLLRQPTQASGRCKGPRPVNIAEL